MSEPTLLDALFHLIDAATDGFDHPATLWFADADPTTDPDGVTIGSKQIDGHPLPHLLGFVAPPEWTVFGLTSCGWMADLDDARAGVRPSQHPSRRRVRQTVLVGRSGATAGAVHFADGGPPLTEPPTEGTVHDALLRCLGLPTAPPERTTAHLFTGRWLADVLDLGRSAERRLTWWDVTPLHPGVRMLAAPSPVGRVPVAELVRIGRALANVCDWALLRQLVVEGKAAGPAPDIAAWMDEGMLSRWLLGSLEPLHVLLPQVVEVVSRSCGRRIGEVVDRLCPGEEVDAPWAVGNA